MQPLDPKHPGLPEPKVCPKCKSYQWKTPQMRPPKANPYCNDPALARRATQPGAATGDGDRPALTRRYPSATLLELAIPQGPAPSPTIAMVRNTRPIAGRFSQRTTFRSAPHYR